MRRGTVAFAAALFAVSTVAAQEADGLLTFIIENPVVPRGEQFTVSVEFDHDDPQTVTVLEDDLPDGIRLIRGPYIRSVGDGTVRVSYTLRADRTGTFRFTGFELSAGGRDFTTRPFAVSAGLYDRRVLYVPPELTWRAEKEEVYVGETVFLHLELVDNRSIVIFDSMSVTPPRTGVFQQVPGFGRIEEERIGDTVLYRLPVATFIFTPSASGRITIPAASVQTGGRSAKAETLILLVKPLPEEIETTGAIGEFRFTSAMDRQQAAVDDEVALRITLSGRGNLGYLIIPDPQYSGVILVSTEETQDLRVGSSGYEGTRGVVYRFVAEEAGEGEVRAPAFVWMDGTDYSIRSANERVYPLRFIVSDGSSEAEETDLFPFEPADARSVLSFRDRPLRSTPWVYLSLLPGPLCFFTVIVLKRRGSGPLAILLLALLAADPALPIGADLTRGDDAYAKGDFAAAIEIYTAAAVELPENPGVRYNLGLALYRSGMQGEGLHEIRSAVLLRPMNSRFRETMLWMEGAMSLDRGVAPALGVDPDLFLVVFIVFFNISFILPIPLRRRSKGGSLIVLILSALIVISSAAGFAYSGWYDAIPKGVIGSAGAEVWRIPDSTARNWLELAPGTSVRIGSEADGFKLVETGYGIKGWIETDRVIPDGVLFRKTAEED